MARLPGVYVTIEDRSYVESQPNIGRNGLVCIMSDRGPHNQVNTLSTNSELFAYYGKPNFEKTGPGHYMAAQFLKYSSNLHVIRPVLIDSPNPENNCSLANIAIKYVPDSGTEEILNGKFVFTNISDAQGEFGNGFISQYVFTNFIGFSNVSIGDTIGNDGIDSALTVDSKGELLNNGEPFLNRIFWLKLSSTYNGTSTVNTDANNELLVNLTGSDPEVLTDYTVSVYNTYANYCTKYYPEPELSTGQFQFVNGSNVVVAEDLASYNSVNVEEWIGTTIGDQSRQVSSKYIDNSNNTTVYKLILDDVYTGESSSGFEQVKIFKPVMIDSQKLSTTANDFNINNPNVLFYFYAKGVGAFYNKIFIQGVRNTAVEKMYTDEDGEALYKYAFLDITIYGENDDGSSTVLEGPWLCSLIDKVGEQNVRDINTGRELFISKIINTRSKYIECKEGINSSILEGLGYEQDQLRLKVMSLFSVAYVNKTQTRGYEGFYLQSGSNGIQFDRWGRLNINHPEIKQLLTNAYNATLKSVDGSIELLLHTVYPWYNIDYVVAGGYDLDIQNAAKYLVDSRGDCLLLADTGYCINAEEDINVRKNSLNWNTWNAMLYTQYREITDPYTGRLLNISPVYHALEKHLYVDNNFFMSEPVAGVTKASISDRVKLAYKPSLPDMENMLDYELNPVITEPDGTYLLTQFTTYKRLSIMKRAHAVKMIHHIKKRLPSLLKGLLQQRASPYWISVGDSIVSGFMAQFTNPNTNKYSFVSYTSNIEFDEERSEIFVSLTLKPIRVIEAINVNIIVT